VGGRRAFAAGGGGGGEEVSTHMRNARFKTKRFHSVRTAITYLQLFLQ